MRELTAWQIGVAGYAPQHVRINIDHSRQREQPGQAQSCISRNGAGVKRDGKVKVGRVS